MTDSLRARNSSTAPKEVYNLNSTSKSSHFSKPSLSASKLDRDGSQSFWDSLGGGLNLVKGEGRVLVGLLLLGGLVRFWKLGDPSSVVFDEVHFGGFANKYIQSRFFMDVHPPLAKLLITLMAYVSGFEGGSFDFKEIGREYGNVPYMAMRALPATLGLLLVPLTYLTLRALKTRATTALLGSLMILFENGLVTQSRFILLDSPLIFFTALTTFFYIGFDNENNVTRDRTGRVGPFSRRWWIWLSLTGLALGAVVSCKWVGLFTIATIGTLTILQLWSLLGDLRVPIPLLARHFVARAICLIVIPAIFYMAMFAIHFAVLSNSGEGDGFMSSEFQHTLQGHGMEDTFADVMLGSHVSIRHLNTQGGYLHSHPSNYPGGSKQQQITLYPHRDDNNIWLLLNSTINPATPNPETHSPPIAILDRSTIVLHHISTNKKLHSHDVRASVTEVDYQNEVSAYGFDGFEGDANDHFMVEIDQLTTKGKVARGKLQTIQTKFRLRHVLTGCYLFSHKVKLPDWGFEQQEVTCNKNPSKDNGLWYIETNTHQALPSDSPKVNYKKPSFLAKFAELQSVMWQTNAGLTDRHAYDSRPATWPFLKRGINFWVKDHRQIYLIGNPFVWWTSSLAVLAYIGVQGLLVLRSQRGCKDYANSQVNYYNGLTTFLFLGWFFHYFPFFLMSRQLFLHHYFPALYFSVLLFATTFDLATSTLKPRLRLQAVGVVGLLTIGTWWYFSPLAYGSTWTKASCNRARWGKHWDFSCADFHDKLSDYKPILDDVLATLPISPTLLDVLPVAEPGRDAFVIQEDAASKSPDAVQGAIKSQDIPQQAQTTGLNDQPQQQEGNAGFIPAIFEATSKQVEKKDVIVESISMVEQVVEDEGKFGREAVQVNNQAVEQV